MAIREACVYLGFNEDIDERVLRERVERQDIAELLRGTHRLTIAAGDVVFVPAGLPHAIGPGMFIVELQEPTNFSILIEHAGLPVTADQAHLGLGWDLALRAVDRRGYALDELGAFMPRREPIGLRDATLLPQIADEYFRARRLTLAPADVLVAPPSFAIGVVLAGDGLVATAGDALPVRAGQTFCLAALAGAAEFRAGARGLEVIICLPPDPERLPGHTLGPIEEQRTI